MTPSVSVKSSPVQPASTGENIIMLFGQIQLLDQRMCGVETTISKIDAKLEQDIKEIKDILSSNLSEIKDSYEKRFVSIDKDIDDMKKDISKATEAVTSIRNIAIFCSVVIPIIISIIQ